MLVLLLQDHQLDLFLLLFQCLDGCLVERNLRLERLNGHLLILECTLLVVDLIRQIVFLDLVRFNGLL